MAIGLLAGLPVVLVAVVLAADLLPAFRTWLGRIHIGRYRDIGVWEEKAARTAARWLNRTPTVQLTDQTRLILLDKLRGQYARRSIQQWQEGALLLGLGDRLRERTDEAALREAKRYLESRFRPDGSWRQPPEQVDAAILAYAVMKLPGIDPDRFRPAYDAVWAMIREHLGEDGTAGYRKAMMKYRYVDTVGFICPFLTAYGVRYGKRECVELALRQLKEFQQRGLHPELYLPCHAYRTDDSAPLGLYGWGRGAAWFALGLADTLGELPAGHPARPELTRTAEAYARAILRVQQPSGAWNWTLTRREAAADASATAALGWFLARMAADTASEPAREGAEKARNYLMKVTRRTGEIDFSQGDTKDIGVYSSRFDLLPFTQGFGLRLSRTLARAPFADQPNQRKRVQDHVHTADRRWNDDDRRSGLAN